MKFVQSVHSCHKHEKESTENFDSGQQEEIVVEVAALGDVVL